MLVTVGSIRTKSTVPKGRLLVKMRHSAIRHVRFLPPDVGVGDIEVNTLRGIRDRGGPHEFLTPQRLDFDLLVHLESGSARHTVDFTDYALEAGDVLWVRAGQVHSWGEIGDIEGPVVMFGPHTVDERTRDLISSHLVRPRNHWLAADLTGAPVSQALTLLILSGNGVRTRERAGLHQVARAHCLAALLVQLTLVEPGGVTPAPGPTHEAYTWFINHIEEHYRSWHQVSQYADRLGYSTRTLNRLARQHTGLSAKELIDERVVLEAKRQLSHGDASVTEIAEELGFDDASNFSSYFRRKTQLTPGMFRAQSRSSGANSQGA